MEWVPLTDTVPLSPSPRWSNRHPVDTLHTLSAPYTHPAQDCTPLHDNTLIVLFEEDLVYVSSPNTLTVLLSRGAARESRGVAQESRGVAQESRGVSQESPLVRELVMPSSCSVCDIQVFRTELSVRGLVVCSAAVYVYTLYHVFKLTKSQVYDVEGATAACRYSLTLLHTSSSEVLDVVQRSDDIFVLTVDEMRCLDSSSTRHCLDNNSRTRHCIDISGIWRTPPPACARTCAYRGDFIVAEPTALHLVNREAAFTTCTIPTDYLLHADRFLDLRVIEGCVLVVTKVYVLLYNITSTELVLKRKYKHHVDDARSAQFYNKHHVDDARSAQFYSSQNVEFAIFSDTKCSYFKFTDIPDSEYVTFVIPFKTVNLLSVQRVVLDKDNYLRLTVDQRTCVTRRIGAGICGALHNANNVLFFLTNHKDIFYSSSEVGDVAEHSDCWERWLCKMKFDREFHTDSHVIEGFYHRTRKDGVNYDNEICKEAEGEDVKKELVAQDPVLVGVTDKFAKSLIDAWEWD